MKKSKTLLFLLLILLFACSKEDEFDNGFFIIMGDDVSSSIYLKKFDPPIEINAKNTYGGYLMDSIDVDGDGVDDVRFASSYSEFNNNGYNKSLTVHNININLQFKKKETKDTVYWYEYETQDTFYHWESRNTELNCSENLSKKFIDASDFYTAPLKKGDTIFLYDFVKYIPLNLPNHGYFPLCEKDSAYSVHLVDGEIDQVFFRYKYLDLWDDKGEEYLFFRIVEDSALKYGWIKLVVDDVANLKIYEVACFIK